MAELFSSSSEEATRSSPTVGEGDGDTGTQGPSSSCARSGDDHHYSPNTLLEIRPPPLHVPKSAYVGHKPPYPEANERAVVDYFVPEDLDDDQTDLSDLMVLDDFVIYRDDSDDPNDRGYISLVGLNDVATKQGGSIFFFDGIVRATDPDSSSKVFYLRRVPFILVTISGYEDVERHTVGDDLWIQSTSCRRRGDIWYRLGKPAPEYAQYHRLFTWLADLSKHLVDYFYSHSNTRVHLEDFKHRFADWLVVHHGEDPDFMAWYSAYDNKKDLRHALVAHSAFLQKHAFDLGPSYLKHPLWSELGLPSNKPAIKEHPATTKDTVVTPYVYQCFKNMPWSDHLKLTDFKGHNKLLYQQRLGQMKFVGGKPKKPAVHSHFEGSVTVPGTTLKVSPGDVVATNKDETSTWKSEEYYWYALVQDIKEAGRRQGAKLRVIWLYHPTDTVCADLTYPHPNELFLSDHCNCGDSPFNISQVVKKVPVTFSTRKPAHVTGLFVRQTYHSADETFTTVKKKDFACVCRRTFVSEPTYETGDTVLVEVTGAKDSSDEELRLEPAEIVTFQGDNVEIRLLLRRYRDFGEASARPNELVYTDRFRTISTEQIHRKCHIRFYTEQERRAGNILAPYDRDGNGDAFYISVRERESTNLIPGGVEVMGEAPKHFKQGFDPQNPPQKLRGLNIFSGGGNFDRGLEEGLAVRSNWAVEWGREQMLTYLANHSNPAGLKLFCGSVNDYLRKALTGSGDHAIAGLGEVDFLSAGSPCQGYSMVNFKKQNEVSMRNSSMVASVAAFIDFYRPKYAIMENVTSMASKQANPSPFSQLLCTFVGMGYQLRILNLDAWSFGAPQSRSRLFVVIAAPGLELPEHPPLTHSHPKNVPRRSLGQAPNGLPYGERHFDVPVFDYVTAEKGIADLPTIGNGMVMSIPEPDHRPGRVEKARNQNIINSIPKVPRVMGLQNALKLGWILPDHADSTARLLDGQKICRSWSRIHPRQLISTVTTVVGPSCRFTGRWLHWSEDRLISIKEVRRAQGFPDSEVIIGKQPQQWKIIGNSVARQVALALGLSIRDACLRNAQRRNRVAQVSSSPEHSGHLVDSTCDLEVAVPIQPQSARSPTSDTTAVEPIFDLKSQQDEPETSNTSVSPDPFTASAYGVISRKRGIQALDKVAIPVVPALGLSKRGKRLKPDH